MAVSHPPARWSILQCTGDIPPGRIGHTMCPNMAEDKIFLYGGVNDNHETTSNYLDDLYVYYVEHKEWKRIEMCGQLQSSRAFHSAVYYNGEIYVFGGCNGRGRFNKLFSISEAGRCQQINVNAQTPSTRYCHSAVIFEDKMYIYAGKCGGRNSNKRLSDLNAFDFSAKLWTECPQNGDKPTARSAHAALTCGRNMIMFGGRNAEGECCEDMFMFNYDTNMWRRIEAPANGALFGRARNSFVVHNGKVIVFGGWNGKKKLNDVFTYLVDSNTLELLHEIDEKCPSRRECHVAVVCKNAMIIFGGRFRGLFMSDTVEFILDLKTLKDHCRDWVIQSRTIDALPNADGKMLPLRIRQYISSWRCLTEPQKNADNGVDSNALNEALSSDNNSQAE